MLKTLVCYHRDLDGFGAAFAFWKKYMQDKKFAAAHGPVDYVSVQYGEAQPDVTGYSHMYVVDFSWDRDICDALAATLELKVIDHHSTAVKALGGAPYAVLDESMSGAELVWKTLHGVPIPELIQYVGDYDLYKFTLPNSREITTYLRGLTWDFEIWDNVDMAVALSEGTVLWDQIQNEARHLFKYGLDADYLGHKTRVMDAPLQYNEAAQLAIEGEEIPFALIYKNVSGRWIVGLRGNQGYDLSCVAAVLGGGGHPNASGFSFAGNFNPAIVGAAVLAAFHALYIGKMTARQARQFAEMQMMQLGNFTLEPFRDPGVIPERVVSEDKEEEPA